ncbi:hypothetical protein SAMN05880582_102194 [Rhizobium sp. RU20A]|uniref:hypothetical protein n=1 Tax=Rhizobium sp. RU20A TaxID=1907412 RepID=UPI000956A1B3|nr:hypothetical protein [Rhizobium sp. RU20A]SIQ57977.1 hypothetical protein SAMN05880582_102194 [Rhizobium sp. RU20A]
MDELVIEPTAAGQAVPLRYLATFETLAPSSSALIREIWREESEHNGGKRPKLAAGILEIATHLIEHGIYEQNREIVELMVGRVSGDIAGALIAQRKRRQPPKSWTFWTIEHQRRLLYLHDAVAADSDPRQLKKARFYPELKPDLRRAVAKTFYSEVVFRNKQGKAAQDIEPVDVASFKDNALDSIITKLGRLLKQRDEIARGETPIQALFYDLLGDPMGHLRPDQQFLHK